MKLSKIYSNKSDIFKMIEFDAGINFILAEDHSVGKSTLFKLIDYCLFKSKPKFLKLEQFEGYEFFLELDLGDNRFLTINRTVSGKENDCIKISNQKDSFIDLPKASFDFFGGETAALEFFQEKSGFVLGNIRNYVTYFLRDQDNQSDTFRLNKFLRSKDIDYKPVVANLLKINGAVIKRKYELEEEISKIEAQIKQNEQGLVFYKTKEAVQEEIDVYRSRLLEKNDQYEKFDFYLAEHNISKELVEKVEQEIATLNATRNSLMREIEYIDTALSNQVSISMNEIQGLFDEIKILFPDDLKNNYEGVVDFNRQITKERKEIFKENRIKFEAELSNTNIKLKELSQERRQLLGVLRETDTMTKFKMLEKEIIDIKTSIKAHEDKLEIFVKIDLLKKNAFVCQGELEVIIKSKDELVKSKFITDLKIIIKELGIIVFGKDLAFSVGFNSKDNIEFALKISNKLGFENLEEDGNTVQKLLCFIFSASLVLTYDSNHFFRFVAFDSPFDGDKNVWQDGVYDALKFLSERGIQTIITTIVDEIKNPANLQEVKDKYVRRLLTEKDKLLNDF